MIRVCDKLQHNALLCISGEYASPLTISDSLILMVEAFKETIFFKLYY